MITKDYRAASVFLPRSEFDEFLFAPICADSNGMTLSVLSMLARTGVDPWGKAAELARLPRETANDAVASFIVALPNGLVSPGDITANAARLSALLPRSLSRNGVSSQSVTVAGTLNSTHVIAIVVLLLYVLVGAGWLLASREPPMQAGLPATGEALARIPVPKPGA